MDTMESPYVLVPFAVVPIAIVVVVIWYLRYRESKLVVERFRRSPHSYIEIDGTRVVQIRIPEVSIITVTPPPTFSKAVKCPVPSYKEYESFEQPPPTYQDYLRLINASGENKVQPQQFKAQKCVDP